MWPIPPYTLGTYIYVALAWIAIVAIVIAAILPLTIWKKEEVLE